MYINTYIYIHVNIHIRICIYTYVVDFYPSITDNLLIKTLKLAQKYHNIVVTEFDAIMHAIRTILYDHKGKVWTKKKSVRRVNGS